MKRLSIKMKITLWFTLSMILLCGIIFLAAAGVTYTTSSQELRYALVNLVEHNLREIEYDDGRFEVDDDFVFFHNGISCLVYDDSGRRIGGYAPYAALEGESFQDGEMRRVAVSDRETYLLYDKLLRDGRYPDLWVRGAVPEEMASYDRSTFLPTAAIVLPLLVVLSSAGGYVLTRQLLRPIKQISKTAEEIGHGNDLSKRIDMAEGGDELHQLVGTFNRMFARLEENFQAQKRFTADASHELRTPITVILAQCEYALEDASGEDELYEALGVIQKQGYRMSRLISSLLQFARMDQNTAAFHRKPLDFSRLVEDVCIEQKELGHKEITLLYRIEPGVFVVGDETYLIRMLENLIRNAYRYGKEGGHTTVTVKETGGWACLQVTDDGVGIAAEDLPRIWDRFYRSDKSRSTSADAYSLGLGLSMVKEIVQIHGGTVDAQSVPGEGSTFTVCLEAMRGGEVKEKGADDLYPEHK